MRHTLPTSTFTSEASGGGGGQTADTLLAALKEREKEKARKTTGDLPSSPQGLGRVRERLGGDRLLESPEGQPLALPRPPLFSPPPPAGDKGLDHLPLLPPGPPGPTGPGFDAGGFSPVGLQDEEEEFAQGLPGVPGVTPKHVNQVFNEIDFDNNGFVGVNELRYLLYTMGERPTDEELDEMVRMLDMEGEGQVDRLQFGKIFKPGHPVLLEMISQAPSAKEDEDDPSPVQKKGKDKEPSETVKTLLLEAASSFMANSSQSKKDRVPVLPKAKGRVRPMSNSRPRSTPSPPAPSTPIFAKMRGSRLAKRQ